MSERQRVLRMFERAIPEFIGRERVIVTPARWKKISPHMNLLKGAAIVGCISFVEREVSCVKPVPFPSFPKSVPKYSGHPRIKALDFWRHQFDKKGDRWYGWDEFVNFYRIRHCFAHNNGILLKGHALHITAFRKKMKKGLIEDRLGRKVNPYYDISPEKEIVLENAAFNRLRILCMEFFILTKVEPPVKLNTGEVVSF